MRSERQLGRNFEKPYYFRLGRGCPVPRKYELRGRLDCFTEGRRDWRADYPARRAIPRLFFPGVFARSGGGALLRQKAVKLCNLAKTGTFSQGRFHFVPTKPDLED